MPLRPPPEFLHSGLSSHVTENCLKTKIFFFVGLVLSASSLISPPLALSLGLIFGLGFTHPYTSATRRWTKLLLQGSVVALGFGMNLHEVVHAGRSGFLYTALSITFAIIVGITAGRMLRVRSRTSYLITAGTAICGGSAIAAVAPIIDADQEETAVSLGAVFILNSVALLIFPALGWMLHLSQQQFGLWSALAIHDTSSVVGATARYGAAALVVGTTVKLARALWIVPICLAAAMLRRSQARIQWPWFILFFCLAALVNTYLPPLAAASHILYIAGKLGLTATLYLIGTGLSLAILRQVGVRPLLQAVMLWLIVGITSLWLIALGVIAL
jgi:uncharacterized integral membrane protein (TIGR00698 family)